MVEGTRRLAAIMFTDLVGYTALSQIDEANALTLLERHNRLLRPIFPRFGGREVKTIGDAFLVEFGSAVEAVHCALEIQRVLGELNARTEELGQIRVRVGVHVGDVVETRGDVLGDAVNIASRIQPLADPGGICVTQQVYDQIRNKVDAELEPLPPQELKNVLYPVGVFRLRLPGSVPGSPPAGNVPNGVHRLAVLPLTNISPDPKDDYFAEGLTEELIAVLSRLRDLRVIARTSVNQYRARTQPISRIGAELGVDAVLEGSVRKADHRLRICLQLVDVGSQAPLWSKTYDRQLDDVFAIQAEVAERTAETLRLQLVGPERKAIAHRPTTSLAAHDLYLKGIFAARQVSPEGTEEALRCFAEATTLDPEFALAFSAWANAYVVAAGNFLPPREAFARAKELVARALALDPASSDAHMAQANVALQSDLDWALAEREFREAIALNPSNTSAHTWYGILLVALQRLDEAKEQFRTALQIDPLWSFAWGWLVNAYTFSGDLAAATELAEHRRDKDPSSVFGRLHVAALYARTGRAPEAFEELAQLVEPLDDEARMLRASLLAFLGRPDEARQLAERWAEQTKTTYIMDEFVAAVYANLGERAKALDLLERDYREGARALWMFYQFPYFAPLRHDPRFVALLRTYRLPVEEGAESASPEPALA